MLGYSRKLDGGVTRVSELLVDNMEEMRFHPFLFSYGSKIKSILQTSASFASYIFILFFSFRQCQILHIIVGSSGDAVRVLPFIALGKLTGKIICIQFHKNAEAILNNLRSNFLKKWVCYAWNHVDLLSFLSNRLKQGHINLCPIATETVVIPNAIASQWLNLKRRLFQERKKDIVFLGRWSKEKGVDDLIHIMSNIKLEVDCDCYTNAPEHIKHANCNFYNWVDEATSIEVIRSAKLLILTSYAEAFPTVLLEAAACGTPFVTYDVGGAADIAEQSGGGISVPLGDEEYFLKSIDILLTDRDQWNECSKSGKEWVSLLSIDNIVEKWRDNYKPLLK